MQSQPAESSRARGLQAARPSTRREALSDTSSEEGDSGSSDTEGDDDEGQAANMDFSEEGGPAEIHSNTDSVHFARHHNLPQNQSSIKQSHRDTLNDDDDAELEQVSSPETSRGATLGQQDFESRPANAAHAGRGNASLTSTGINRGKQANAALPSNGSQRQTPSLQGSGREELTGKRQKPFVTKSGSSEEPRRKSSSVTNADQEDQDEDSDAGAHLFDSPYMPSSPRITSSTNLASLPSQAGSGKETLSDPYTLSWADKEDSSRSRAEGSLLQSLASTAQSRPSWLMRRRSSSRSKSGSGVVNRSAQSEDELSDPANNGYSYGYGFDDEEDDQRGYVGRATDLIGALWNVGSGMVWGRPSEGSPSSSKDPSVQKPSK